MEIFKDLSTELKDDTNIFINNREAYNLTGYIVNPKLTNVAIVIRRLLYSQDKAGGSILTGGSKFSFFLEKDTENSWISSDSKLELRKVE